MSNDHRSPSHASAPAPTAPASTSSTMNGSPSDQARTYSTTPLGTSSEPRQAAVIRPRSSVASASSSRTVAVRAAIRPCSRRSAALASSDRTVATHRTGWVRSASTRYSSTASVSWSAQWRSSSTSSTADSPATAVRSRTTPSASTTGGSWVVSPGVRHSGSSLPRAGRNGDSPGRSGSPWLRKWESKASENGRNGTGTSACTPRPKRTCTPDVARSGDDLAHQPRLADPGLPADEDHASGTSLGLGQRRAGGVEHLIAPDQLPTQKAPHRPSIAPIRAGSHGPIGERQ